MPGVVEEPGDRWLEASSFTNAFPVHRLGLEVGEHADAPAAYVRVTDEGVERLDPQYLRLPDDGDRRRYHYRSPALEFKADLLFDESGVVLENRYRARHGQWRQLRWSARTDGTCWVGVAIDVTDEIGIGAAAQPSAAPPERAAVAFPGSMGTGRVALAVAAAVCLLAVAGVVIDPPDLGLSDARSEPAWSGGEGPPALIGPVNGAGPLDTVALGRDPAARLLGPRPEPPDTLHR